MARVLWSDLKRLALFDIEWELSLLGPWGNSLKILLVFNRPWVKGHSMVNLSVISKYLSRAADSFREAIDLNKKEKWPEDRPMWHTTSDWRPWRIAPPHYHLLPTIMQEWGNPSFESIVDTIALQLLHQMQVRDSIRSFVEVKTKCIYIQGRHVLCCKTNH